MSITAMKSKLPVATKAQRVTKTSLDTILITPAGINAWITPPFQRPVRENDKVRALAEEMRHNGGVFPGILTLGILNGATFLLDGGHRRSAFLMSGCMEGYADVRTHYFETMADMGEEFVQLNSQLVRMRPDDILRGLEGSHPILRAIREKCPFVGYDQIRRGTNAPLVSMSTLLRNWLGSTGDIPKLGGIGGGGSTAGMVNRITSDDVRDMTDFLNLAYDAFGRDPEYSKLWGSLNILICMWLYRNIVLSAYSAKSVQINKEQFKRCLMSLSASTHYLDWLVGRSTSERERSPAYSKIKAIFMKRIETDLGRKVSLPAPAWSHMFHRRDLL